MSSYKASLFNHRAVSIVGTLLALTLSFGCSSGSDETPSVETDVKSAIDSGAVRPLEGSYSKPARQAAPEQVMAAKEGSGIGREEDIGHPSLTDDEKIERRIYTPKDVEGKWKAVKLLIKNKQDEESNEIMTVTVGSDFMLGNTGLKVTVGPFFPNFVLNESTYSSMDNSLINPAVQLVVEENGKILYKGWTFKRFPGLYGFEHDVYAFELLDAIPTDVS